jgi:hypothetical protein
MSNKIITAVLGSLNSSIESLIRLDNQLSAPGPLVLSELQTWTWEDLWIVGRSKKWPSNSPHGTVSTSGNHPAVSDFRPIKIQGDSDNLYRLLRLKDRIPADLLPAITKVIYSFSFGISDSTACQAFEFECQRQIGLKIWNMAFQLKPGAPNGFWFVSAFDYTAGDWKTLSVTIDPALFTGGKMAQLIAEFTLSPLGTRHDALSFNGNRLTVGLEQATATAKGSDNYFNVAIQPDANGAAAPYKISVDSVSVSLQ